MLTSKPINKCPHICYRTFNMPRLAYKIRQCRELKGWTQERLAREIGVSLNTVQRWESGKNQPSPLALEKLQRLLDDVLDGDQLRMLLE
jgi:putative transcriptional regulator